MYRILPVADDFLEICDECGFHGGLVAMDAAAAMFRSLGERWRSAFRHPGELLRERPAPETWCAIEYAQHTAFAVAAIEWAAGEFVAGRSPDWDNEPADLAGRFEHDEHACEQFDVEATLGILTAAAVSMGAFAAKLTPGEAGRRADYGNGRVINTAAVVRHALHDAEHHLLDIRRGLARLQLASS